jgi:predicted protein tyrosine phosphatase
MSSARHIVTKLLFICSRNEIRSLTAERMFDGSPHYQARSAGTQPQARVKVTEGLLGWADLVFVMEKSHLRRLEERFPEAIADKPVICLNIPDDYAFMEPALIEELEGKLPPHLPTWPS